MNPLVSQIRGQVLQLDTMEDVNEVYAALKTQTDRIQRATKLEFRSGDRVQFDAGKYKGTLTGTVVRRLQKNIRVKVDGAGEWTVAPSLLRKVGP